MGWYVSERDREGKLIEKEEGKRKSKERERAKRYILMRNKEKYTKKA